MSDAGSPSAPPSAISSVACPTFADVIIPRPLNRAFTYIIPSHLQNRLCIGSRVLVPFGSTTLQGVVVSLFKRVAVEGLLNHSARGGLLTRLREITALLDEPPESGLPADLITLSRLVSERYLTPWGQCLRLILPATPTRKSSRRYRLTDTGRALLGGSDNLTQLSSTSRTVLLRLAKAPKGLSVTTLHHAVRGPLTHTLATLKRRRLMQEFDEERENRPKRRNSVPNVHASAATESSLVHDEPGSIIYPLSSEMDRIHASVAAGTYTCILLSLPVHQRLDCLIQATEGAFSCNRTVLIIAPEIARAEAIATQLRSRWGDQVELFHGSLPAATRAEVWSRVRRGRIRLVVGTRSAIFTPLASLGLICVEDEHDPSLKEETEPRYHARDVASIRAQMHGAALVLLTAHPSLETVHSYYSEAAGDEITAEGRRGKELVILKPSMSSPSIETVDLRQQPYGILLSDPLIAGLAAAIDAQAGAILFLNRKGFASALLCRECGRSPQCPQCSIALTFYKQAGHLACYYCGTTAPLPDACPFCLAAKLEPVGAGTEQIEALLRRRFPTARIGRLDREVSRAHTDIIRRQVCSRDIDILIGTQMLFQGGPLPQVGFVGLILADAGLHLPDFRAGERTYHTLVGAVAMARPQEVGGHVVLQTYLPTHHVIEAVRKQQPAIFYDQELAFRKMLDYPPFFHLISLRVTGRDRDHVKDAAEQWVEQLRAAAIPARASSSRIAGIRMPTHAIEWVGKEGTGQVSVLGPVPCATAQIRGRYRWQLLVKSACAEMGRTAVRTTLDELQRVRGRSGLKYEVDVDPVTLM